MSASKTGLSIGQIILDEVSFRHCDDYLAMSAKTPAHVGDVDVHIAAGASNDGSTGLVRIRITTRPANDPVYHFDVSYVGLFASENLPEGVALEDYLRVSGATTLIPFVRQVIADLTQKGRFGPIWLSPINVLALITQASVIASDRKQKEKVTAKRSKKKTTTKAKRKKGRRSPKTAGSTPR